MSERDIEEMFNYADKDADGKISYSEFKIMINPAKQPQPPKPTRADFVQKTQREAPKVKDACPAQVSPNQTSNSVSSVAEPQTLSVANILLHNANTVNMTIKGQTIMNENGGKKGQEGKKKSGARK